MLQAIVFDMAGTTINEDNLVYKTLRSSIQEAGVTVSLDHVLLHGAGKEKLNAIVDILLASNASDLPNLSAQEIHLDFLDRLAKAYESTPISAFEGVSEIFQFCKSNGIQVVLNTGYNRNTANSLLEKLPSTINDLVDLLVTADDVENSRPAPDMILLAMEELGITNSSNVWKIGDSGIDIEEGQQAGCGRSIGITTGAQTREQLLTATPDAVIDHLSELIPMIEAIQAG